MIAITILARRTVAVFGLGASGLAAAEALLAGGSRVVAWDDNEAARDAAAKRNIPIEDLSQAEWKRFSALVLAPGVPLTHPKPHWTVERAKAHKVPVIGDVELFCRQRSRVGPLAPFIAITGTNGKSTTTALIAHLLRCDRRNVQVGGNLGTPILSLDPLTAATFYVIELSSFQIDLTPSLAPTVGVLLNITPDHLDRHGTMENYAAIKEQLVVAAGQACIGVDDDYCRAIADRVGRKRFVHRFSTDADFASGYHLADGKLRFDSPENGIAVDMADMTTMRALKGRHNAQNALAALAAMGALGSVLSSSRVSLFLRREKSLRRGLFESEADWQFRETKNKGWPVNDPAIAERRKAAMQAAYDSFPGLAHRMEQIGTQGRVLFVNDSKATNADSAEKALATWDRDIYWILGGKAKDGGIDLLVPLFSHVAKAYLIGEATEAFAETLEGKVLYERCGTLDRAVEAAAKDAATATGPEPVVLLSPACASYDQYRNFELRGEHFRSLATSLPDFASRPSAQLPGREQ
jgi:UDP-N-acetylmuramoylalanine--D-glutamate ligase